MPTDVEVMEGDYVAYKASYEGIPFSIENYTFIYWISPSSPSSYYVYYPGTKYDFDVSRGIHAQWGYIVSYNTQGGSEIKNDSLLIEIGANKSLDVLPMFIQPSSDPIREGYAFKGWYMEKECVTPCIFNDPNNRLIENTTLYAKWEALEAPAPITYHTLPLTIAPGIWCNYAAGDLTVSEKDHLFLQFNAEDGKTTDDILFMVDGVETAFTISDNGGSYILSPITRDHTILIAQRQYCVTIPTLDGASCDRGSGEHQVDYGSPFRFCLTFDEGQNPEAVQVLANGIVLTPDAPRADMLTYTIDQVTEPIDIKVEGLYATSNAALEQGVRLAIDNGQLTIDNSGPAVDVAVYGITGQSVVQLRALRGSKTVSLAPGVYIVRAGETTTKVVVN